MKKIIPVLILLFVFAGSVVTAQFTNEFVTYSTANTPVFSGNNFKSIWVGKGNRIWAGTQYQGLYWFDTTRKAWTKSSSLTNVFINHIQSDNNGGIWIAQSGTSGLVGGGSNTAGGVNYFPDTTDTGMQFFSTGNTLSSRNVRGIYLDTFNTPADDTRRIWAAQATFVTSGNTNAGGVSKWQYISSGNFQKNYLGLQVFPNTNLVSAGTPSCYTACGNKAEVWVGAETNYTIATGSTTQILRYEATTGQFLGGYDQNGGFDNTRLFYNNQPRVYIDSSSKGVLPAGFRTTAMYVDAEDRRWIGLRSGGVVVKIGNTWKLVNMPTIFPPGTTVNFNAITSDEFGYIYIGTSTGLVVFDNGGEVTDTTFYKRLTTIDSLPSNNITGLAYDKAGGRMLITTDAGVTFWKIRYKIDVRMVWDYSFPDRANQPIGVAADGVSRVYLKIKKASDTLPDIKSVNVKLKNFDALQSNIRGKLKKALVIDKYSEEASTATAPDVTINFGDLRPALPKEYWFWYISPEDFCNDTLSAFASLRRRFDTLVVIATYNNDTKDTMEYKIGIVRPPTLFVHGLASAPEAWEYIRHNHYGQYVPFINSPVLTYKRAPKMDPIGFFHKNGLQLLGGDVSAYNNNEDRLNTLQGNIAAIRGMRYAANQVDYVCHSMGGIMIRSAIGFFPQKFFSGEGDPFIYKNYDKGYTHKIITINTPHNGAPIADVLDQFVPLAPARFRVLLNDAYNWKPVLFGGFLKPVGNNSFLDAFGSFVATDAVNNLQVTDARGGVNMLKTPAKYHMIVSDLDWFNYNENLGAADYFLPIIYKIILRVMYNSTYDDAVFNPATAEATRIFIRNIISQEPKIMLANFLNWMSEKRGYPNYLSSSDGIVPLMSQTARQSETELHITKFYCTDTAGGSQGLNANHSSQLQRDDVGQRVFQLLNTKRSSIIFADEIPADNDPETPYLLRQAGNTQSRPLVGAVSQFFYDTSKVKIDTPAPGGIVYADSTIPVKFRIKDTSRLAYYSIYFQLADSLRIIKTRAQQTISFKVSPSFGGTNKIWAMAAYDNTASNGVDYYLDSVIVTANNLAPLQGFRIKPDMVEIRTGEPYYPEYEVNYNNNWVALPNNAAGINIAIDSVNTVSYSAGNGSFNGLKAGAAIANFSFNGFADSLFFKVILPYNANCINRTIAGGSFRNPAIWSKGTIPDICDSVIISSTHAVTVDTSIIIRALRISSGGTLTINNATYTLKLGQGDDAFSMADNYGTLAISNGGLYINGRIKSNAASTFSMSGGTLTVDANKGVNVMSVSDGTALFEAAAGMTSFNFSGGTLQLNDPPFGAASQAINCPYDFGNNSTLILGISTSAKTSKNTDGFGGLSFPNKIGRLIINAGTRNGNRQFVNKKTLNAKTSLEVRTGSGIIIQAPLNVTQ
ncbi:MAG: hypothetical protein IPP72_13370 [Chitinophagaceae bacterium]|nr:hypothetical protein [Chitinophagaceae bacterium]